VAGSNTTNPTLEFYEGSIQQCVSIEDDTTAGFTQYMARLNESLAQLSTVKPMVLSEIYALAAELSRHESSYSDLVTFIDEGNALTLKEVLRICLKYSRERPSADNAYRAMRDADAVCNHACLLCCNLDFCGSETPRPSRSRSSPRSHSSSRAGPRLALSATAALGPVNNYWRSQGLAHHYHTFAAILQENYVSPHQVLLDADIDQFSHPDPALPS
jgi:hypothetical protein